jgi:hypothetical protein
MISTRGSRDNNNIAKVVLKGVGGVEIKREVRNGRTKEGGRGGGEEFQTDHKKTKKEGRKDVGKEGRKKPAARVCKSIQSILRPSFPVIHVCSPIKSGVQWNCEHKRNSQTSHVGGTRRLKVNNTEMRLLTHVEGRQYS